MKIEANAADLISALSRVAGAIDKRHAMPVLSHALFRAVGLGVEVTGSDLILVSRVTAPCSAGGSPFAVGAHDAIERLKALPPGTVKLDVDGSRLTMRSGGRKFVLPIRDGSEFPELPRDDEDAPALTIQSSSLGAAIDATTYAVNPVENAGANTGGVCLRWRGGKLTVAGLDGRRLAYSWIDGVPGEDRTIVIPRRAAHELRRMCDRAESVEVHVGRSRLSAKVDTWAMSCATLGDTFPPFEDIVKPPKGTVTMPRAALVSACDGSSIAASGDLAGMCLDVSVGAVQASSYGGEGEFSEAIPAVADGEAVGVGIMFEPSFMRQALASLSGPDVSLEIADKLSPIVIREANTVAVVMPKRS